MHAIQYSKAANEMKMIVYQSTQCPSVFQWYTGIRSRNEGINA